MKILTGNGKKVEEEYLRGGTRAGNENTVQFSAIYHVTLSFSLPSLSMVQLNALLSFT